MSSNMWLTDQNSAYSRESCISRSILRVVPNWEVFPVARRRRDMGPIFPSALLQPTMVLLPVIFHRNRPNHLPSVEDFADRLCIIRYRPTRIELLRIQLLASNNVIHEAAVKNKDCTFYTERISLDSGPKSSSIR